MVDQLENYVHRPLRYKSIDRIGEMGLGLVWLGLALLFWLQASAPHNSLLHSRNIFGLCCAVLLLVLIYGQKALKSRFTYPRTGFVKYRPVGAKPGFGSQSVALVQSRRTHSYCAASRLRWPY